MKRFSLAIAALLLIFAQGAEAQTRNVSNLVSGSGSATGTGATTIISAPSGSANRRLYITDVECARTDAGTTGIFVTLNDDGATVIVLPNTGGGGGNNMNFQSPLTVPAGTALKFTASSGVTTAYCNAQGFTGN